MSACGLCTDRHIDIRCRQHGALAPEPYQPPLWQPDTAAPIVLLLPFLEPPITANEARSGSTHWAHQAEPKKRVAAAVLAVVRAAGVPKLERCSITLTWSLPDYRKQDPDGLFVMIKAAIDALTPPTEAIPRGSLTKAGTARKKAQAAKIGASILRDDSARYVESTTCRILLGQPVQQIVLRLDPLPALVIPPPAPRGRRGR